MRKWNFCAGPAAIPEEALIEAQNELLEWGLSGSSVMEVSHRSDLFAEVAASSTKDIKALLNIAEIRLEKEGKIYVVVDAFLLVWKEIPKYKILYKFFKLPIVYHFFYIGYEIVAFFLYLKNRKQLKN